MTATTVEAEARVLLSPDAPRSQWLAARRQGIGGSDASTVADLNPYSSRYALWLDKTGRAPERPDNDAMEWGRRLEPVVAKWFHDFKGIGVERAGLMASTERPWQIVSVDRLTADGGGLEIKTLSWRVESDWDDEQIPDHAELQAQHAMAVTGRMHWWVVGLVDGRRPLIRMVLRDERLIHDLTEMERRFWFDHVLADVEPAVDAAALPAVKQRYRRVTPDKAVAVAADQLDPVLARFDAAKARIKEATAEKNAAEAELRAMFGDAEGIRVGDTVRATCKETSRDGYTVQSTTYRKLHIVKQQKGNHHG